VDKSNNVGSDSCRGQRGNHFLLGATHFGYTFWSAKFSPRDCQLEAQLKLVSPVISCETTMWKAWIGFNASHSMGAVLFGAVYGYLAVVHDNFLMRSDFFAFLGLLFLAGYPLLGKLYWFSIPFRCIALAFFLYGLGLLVGRA
jgi:hypothetical protein